MSDRRYSSRRWLRVRAAVLRRDMYFCRIEPGCTERATVCDHIVPATPAMSDAMFFGMGNLRAGCRDHNLARGFASKPTVLATDADSDVIRTDYT